MRAFFFGVVTVICLTEAASAQTGSVIGRISEGATRAPVTGARVRVLATGGAVAGSTVTGEDGRYRITGLPVGRHELSVTAIGYNPRRDPVDITANGTTTLDFALVATPSQLDAVVVSASRRAERAQEAPASVSVVSADVIEKRPGISTADHLGSVPGVDIAQTGVLGANVVVRGFNAAFSSALQVLTDYRISAVPGLQVNRFSALSPGADDLERIEVVLGPAAALYGPNTANGVIHLLTKSPLVSSGTVVSVAAGERNAFLGSFRTSQKITDNLGIKLSGSTFTAREWPLADTTETRLRGVAQTSLAAFRTRALAAGITESQVSDSIARTPSLFALTRIGLRPENARRYGVDFRADYRPVPSLTTVLQVGRSSNSSTELTGISPAAQNAYTVDHYQLRASSGRFFAQTYAEIGNSGSTYTTRTGESVTDKSRLIVGQLQHGLSLVDGRQDFTYGVDYLNTEPISEGTVYGRNEANDKIRQYGVYLQSESRLTDKLRLVLAGRVDGHSVVKGKEFSPRAGLVFEPTPTQAFRVTYNRAFQAPTAINLYLDRLSSRSGPYAVRAIAPGTTGFNFRMPDGALAVRSPFASAGANTRIAFSRAESSREAIIFLAATGRITPAEAGRLIAANPNFTVIGRNPQTGVAGVFDPASIANIDAIENEKSDVVELGYKGIIREKFFVGLDLWHLKRSNFISQLFAPAPTLLVSGPEVAAFLLANGIDATRAAAAAAAAAVTPVSVVAAAENDIYKDGVPILITYKNYASVDLNGVDFTAQYANDGWKLGAVASLVSDNYFTFGAEQPIALNAPKTKGSLSAGYDGTSALSGEARVRYNDAFPVYTGVYIGNSCVEPAGRGLGACVPASALVDMRLGYRLPGLTGTTVSLNVSNVLDHRVKTFIGTAEIGRLAMVQVRREF
ncbi:MAG: TonB-dependent receptor [Gemmatimonadaceae bacterium]